MRRIRVVYGFKVRQFFGPLRHSAAALVLLGLVAVFTLPVVLVVGYFLPDTPVWSSPRLGDLFAAGLSTFLAFDLLFALSGGTLTHPAEIEFFATSRIRPREYLLADVLFQFTVTDVLAVPMLLMAGAGLGLRLGIWAEVAGAILAFLAFAGIGLALGQAAGLAVASRRRGARTAIVALVVLLMLPAGNFFWPALPTYFQAPFPSSAAAYLLLGVIRGGPVAIPALTLALFGVAAVIAWLVFSREDVFPNLRPTMRVAFGQMDLRRQAMKQEALTRGLSALTRRFTVDLSKGAPVGMMTRLHLTRIVRDGSILMVGLLTGLLVLIGAVNRASEPTPSDVSILTTGWTALLIPVILSFNWNATERANLWTVAMAPRYVGTYFRGLYRALAGVTMGAAVVGALAAGGLSALGVLAAVLMAFAACGSSVAVVAAIRIPTDAFSLKSAIPFLVVPLVALGVGAPVLGLALLESSVGVLAWPIAVAYAVLVLGLFDRVPMWAASRFEL